MPAKPKRPPFFSQEHESWVIPLTQGVIVLVDEDVAKTLGSLNWCAASHRDGRWYAIRTPPPKDRREGMPTIRMHRVIVRAKKGIEVDHRKHYPFGDRIVDNRRSNLHTCTDKQTAYNSRKRQNTGSKFKGVSWFIHSRKWYGHIRHDGTLIHLGCFTDPLKAALAYDAAARRLFGEFAATNESLGLLPKRTP